METDSSGTYKIPIIQTVRNGRNELKFFIHKQDVMIRKTTWVVDVNTDTGETSIVSQSDEYSSSALLDGIGTTQALIVRSGTQETVPQISYSGSPFTFTKGVAIPNIAAKITGSSPTSCTSNPDLPAGLKIENSNCVISGTPTTIQSATTYTIRASNDYGTRTTEIMITVNDIPPSAFSYSVSSFVLTQDVGVPSVIPTYSGTIGSCTSSPALPTGMSLSNSCVISGTPTVSQATSNYTITASNPYGSTTFVISIAINLNPPTSLTYVGSPYTFTKGVGISTITPTFNGTLTSCTASPGLPSGLSINNLTCEISGTPTVLQTATNYTITASNSHGFATANISITVNDVAPTSLSYAGNPFVFTKDTLITTVSPTFTGTPTSYSVSPSLPTGLSIHLTTGQLAGTPTVLATVNTYTVTATNTGGSTTFGLTITVNDVAPSGLTYAGGPFTFTDGQAISSLTPSLGGGSVISCASNPILPNGLSINNSCVISGTPNTQGSSVTTYTITASNSGGSVNTTISINIKVCYAWGCFQDLGNGTVSFTGAGMGSDGVDYSGTTLTWMKCNQGQTWNSGTNGCDGSAVTYQFCSTLDNNCNGGATGNELGVGGIIGGSTSSAYDSCNNIGTFAGKTNWRIPTRNELKTLIHCNDKTMPANQTNCGAGNYLSPVINKLFLNEVVSAYLSSTTFSSNSSYAWNINFDGGGIFYDVKTVNSYYYVRCVTGP
ncbi:MAG: putative Ig domain-containing protein [Leptospiraceae bacterium]|nr:putative Ig domain-containing protein [Leptospiraceae bacterium]